MEDANMPFPFHVTIVTDLDNIAEGNALASSIDDIGPAFGNALYAAREEPTVAIMTLVDARLTVSGKAAVDSAFVGNPNFEVYYGENSTAVAKDDLALVVWVDPADQE